ncbi:MAG: hypothetical protein OEW05_11340, partial [Candidatus Aminicenantes bacterium]|nr:hypothetical protein [Candidatus Aminicenantes bacterium]
MREDKDRKKRACTAAGRAGGLIAGAVILLLAAAPSRHEAQRQTTLGTVAGTIEKGDFRFSYDERGISLLANPHDPFGAVLMPAVAPGFRSGVASKDSGQDKGRPPVLGLVLSYRLEGSGDWMDITPRGQKSTASPETGTVTYVRDGPETPLRVVEAFTTDGRVFDWTIDLETTSESTVEVGDLGIVIPAVGPMGENPRQIFERGFLRHQFVSGHGSFIYFVRASGAPPFLLVTVLPGTKLEFT